MGNFTNGEQPLTAGDGVVPENTIIYDDFTWCKFIILICKKEHINTYLSVI
jgi:hypothetical protein